MKDVEISVVIPCLNEEETIGTCVKKALTAINELGVGGEVVVVDNGSNDRSAEVSRNAGARVVDQPERGYGAAYLKGFDEAKGKYVVMGDADDTYDFLDIPKFIEKLRGGADFVIGSRFRGKILPGAMPWLHRYVGNPVLSFILNRFFRLNVSDTHCGMRGMTKDALRRMNLQTTGMELASEMIINASRAGLRIEEIPITYHPRKGESKLNSISDGWRHLRFMLMYSPTHLFLIPGVILMAVGLAFLILLLPGPLRLGSLNLGVHYMIIASLLFILGVQTIWTGLFAKVYSVTERFGSEDRIIGFMTRHFNLEKGIALGLTVLLAGLGLYVYILWKWVVSGFGALQELRVGILALTLSVTGIQTIFSSFFLSMLGIRKRRRH